MLKIKSICLYFFMAIFFYGCASLNPFSTSESEDKYFQITSKDETLFKDIMRIKVDCTKENSVGTRRVLINGAEYSSDIAIKYCLRKNLVDTNVGLKKVFLHRIVDAREDASVFSYIGRKGKITALDSSPSLEALFYMFLKQELNSRGIMVVETQTSPYTYRLDFTFNKTDGFYSRINQTLDGKLEAKLNISNINFNKDFNINTKQYVKNLKIRNSDEFDFFVGLLVKQAAIKTANIITKF
ncbi:outer membrane liproprotein [Campylobacter pinnipediorum subsp. pinnipediorum]|uniref:YajG family lipoprotein n=1 Tax=Campylobacter pinnipediorum TaxID=1965231 RepID=UPI000994B9BD|nr:YajG family lipoprotein [Campylobacter pinnipediorum]AQW85017.1 outer membrane liproprotein [Campylobacter pinnipediorum subsp. pinnipediorum]